MSHGVVLIVEDNAEVRETLKDLFESRGYKVRTAEDGQMGLRALQENGSPCLVVLDLMMPVMDGWQFLEVLSKEADLPHPRVLVLSGVTDALEMDNVRMLYDCAVMRKPPQIESLMQIAEEACGSPA